MMELTDELKADDLLKLNNVVDPEDESITKHLVDLRHNEVDKNTLISLVTGTLDTCKPNIKVKRMKKIKPKKRTLEEFKNWLEGLQEFQENDWVPSSDQWEHIKLSIYAIKEPSQAKPIKEIINSGPVPTSPVVSSFDLPVPTSPVVSSFDLPVPRAPTGQTFDMRNPENVKRDIDTSDGQYTSDFE